MSPGLPEGLSKKSPNVYKKVAQNFLRQFSLQKLKILTPFKKLQTVWPSEPKNVATGFEKSPKQQ